MSNVVYLHEHDAHDDESGEPIGGHCMHDAKAATTYTLAGNAYVTLKSAKSGKHYTYRVALAKAKPDAHWGDKPALWFVSLMTEPEVYNYIGVFQKLGGFRTTAKSKLTKEAPAVKAFEFFERNVLRCNHMPTDLEVWHEGTCGRCGRQLTHPESIESGLGPVCRGLM